MVDPHRPPPNLDTVSLDARYLAAWSEVNTRITQRQNALYIFLAISLAIIAFIFSSNHLQDVEIRAVMLLSIPVTALVLAFLNAKHDETIALLRSFLAQCEISGQGYSSEILKALSYNFNTDLVDPARRYRKYHDWAFIGAIGLICTVGALLIIAFGANALSTPGKLPSNASGWTFAAVASAIYILAYSGFSLWAIYLIWKGPWHESRSPFRKHKETA
jgi:hypothetical protein